MNDLIETIRLATLPDASPETRAAGASTCRTILATLEPPIQSIEQPATNLAQIAAGLVTALRGVPADQLLDLAIARLRAALPSGTEVERVDPVKFRLIQVQPREPSP